MSGEGFFQRFLGTAGTLGGGLVGGAGGAIGGAAVDGAIGAGAGTMVGPGGTLVGGAAGAGVGAVTGGIAGGTVGAAVGNQAGKSAGAWIDDTAGGRYVNSKVDDFQDWLYGEDEAKKVDAGAQAKAEDLTCATCKNNPCAKYACGNPTSEYRGGAHGCVGTPENKTGNKGTIHSHHMPADKYSPLPRPAGPAIQMKDVDHRLTASYGSKVNGPSYLAQRTALASGQTMRAIQMDILNVQAIAEMEGDPERYDDAIHQMMRYADCLYEHGYIR